MSGNGFDENPFGEPNLDNPFAVSLTTKFYWWKPYTHTDTHTHINMCTCVHELNSGAECMFCVCVCAWCRCNDDNTCAYLHMYVYVPPTHLKLQLIFVEFSFIGFSSILSCLGSCHTAGDTYVYHVDQRSTITGGLQSLWGASEATIADQLDQYGSRCSTALTECSASAAQLIGCIGAQHQHTDHFGGVAGITHMFACVYIQTVLGPVMVAPVGTTRITVICVCVCVVSCIAVACHTQTWLSLSVCVYVSVSMIEFVWAFVVWHVEW